MTEIDKTIATKSPDPAIHLRSEEVQEILSAPPNWMLSWSVTIIFFVLLLLLFFAWFIKYPDVVAGQVKITTVNPAVRLVSYSSGKLISLNKKDKDKARKGETIAIIENLLTEETSTAVRTYIDYLKTGLQRSDVPLPLPDNLSVSGELQPEFNKLTSLVKIYNRTVTDSFFRKNIRDLNVQIAQYRDLIGLSTDQTRLSGQEVKNALDKYKVNQQLYENKAISKLDFIAEENQYFLIQKQASDLEKIKIQNLIALTDYEKQVNELRAQHENKLFETAYTLYEQVNTIQNQLLQWERQYLIKAPFNGTVSYLNSWTSNRYIPQGEELFTVLPDEQEFIGLAMIPSANFGKIKVGQAANLRVDNYAYNELGELTGKVRSIALAPGADNNYRIEITLDNGLTSTHKKNFEYKPEMTGTAQIVTEDLSFLDRIFYRFKKLATR